MNKNLLAATAIAFLAFATPAAHAAVKAEAVHPQPTYTLESQTGIDVMAGAKITGPVTITGPKPGPPPKLLKKRTPVKPKPLPRIGSLATEAKETA